MAHVTSNDVEAVLDEVFGHDKWAQPQFDPNEDIAPPYAVLMPYKFNLVHANGVMWIDRCAYDVTICTRYRDRALEKAMFDAFRAHEVTVLEVTPSYDPDERLMLVTFTTAPVAESED